MYIIHCHDLKILQNKFVSLNNIIKKYNLKGFKIITNLFESISNNKIRNTIKMQTGKLRKNLNHRSWLTT